MGFRKRAKAQGKRKRTQNRLILPKPATPEDQNVVSRMNAIVVSKNILRDIGNFLVGLLYYSA